ncbi:MAG: T9SS type A sorting domain-containing protein, partial [Bacteroidota bacterium]
NKTFEFDNYVIQFFDLTGKLIYLFKIKNQQSNIFHLPFISHGIYLYNILSNRKVFQSGKISVLQ